MRSCCKLFVRPAPNGHALIRLARALAVTTMLLSSSTRSPSSSPFETSHIPTSTCLNVPTAISPCSVTAIDINSSSSSTMAEKVRTPAPPSPLASSVQATSACFPTVCQDQTPTMNRRLHLLEDDWNRAPTNT